MTDKRKVSVWVVIGLFMIVTTFHVGFYAAAFEQDSSRGLSWPYAIAVDLAIILCSYFTKYQISRWPAWSGYFLFTVMSGLMNWGWVKPTDIPAVSYAVFPTIAIALLGWLWRQVDKLGGTKSVPKSVPLAQPMAQPTAPSLDQLTQRLDTDLLSEAQQVARIENWLAQPNGTSATEMAQKLGMSRRTFYRRIDTLKAQNGNANVREENHNHNS